VCANNVYFYTFIFARKRRNTAESALLALNIFI
jgi:hypothetical protein